MPNGIGNVRKGGVFGSDWTGRVPAYILLFPYMGCFPSGKDSPPRGILLDQKHQSLQRLSVVVMSQRAERPIYSSSSPSSRACRAASSSAHWRGDR